VCACVYLCVCLCGLKSGVCDAVSAAPYPLAHADFDHTSACSPAAFAVGGVSVVGVANVGFFIVVSIVVLLLVVVLVLVVVSPPVVGLRGAEQLEWGGLRSHHLALRCLE
jgi:hypothetical protein